MKIEELRDMLLDSAKIEELSTFVYQMSAE